MSLVGPLVSLARARIRPGAVGCSWVKRTLNGWHEAPSFGHPFDGRVSSYRFRCLVMDLVLKLIPLLILWRPVRRQPDRELCS